MEKSNFDKEHKKKNPKTSAEKHKFEPKYTDFSIKNRCFSMEEGEDFT